jgi:signal transduction histidine kinase
MQGFGMQGRGSPPFKLRLFAAPALGSVPGLATAIVAGSAAAALGLAGLAFAAGRGIEERRRREAAEAEGQRLQSIALAGSGLAHRLRNPLAVIKGTAQMLETHLTESQRQRAERIVSASERMETILSRLLDFARPIAPQPASFDLAALVSEVTTRSPGPIEVHSGGALSVRADREHVESILEEFLANARVFDPSGTIDVSIRRDRERVVVEVADQGPGLTLDAVSAFEPYVTTRPEGTGLGLAIVKSLARANGGAVSLAGRSGGGCVASLILPKGEA